MRPLPPLPDEPFVSIYTTVYNHERFVAEAIESVLSQGWPEDRYEYVVIDDGSTDGSQAAIEPYLDHITYIRQENEGVRRTVNRVMGLMHGDLITSVSGDDAWPAGKLERQVRFMQENPNVGLCYSDLEVIDDEGTTLHESFMDWQKFLDPSRRTRGALLRQNFVAGGGVMLRGAVKPLFHPIPDHAPWEDYWWAWAIGREAELGYLDAVTYRYRRHDANLTLGATGARRTSAMRSELQWRRWMLRDVRAGDATWIELGQGIGAFKAFIRGLEREDEDCRKLLTVSEADQRSADAGLRRAEEAIRRDDGDGALIACANALGANPWSREVDDLVTDLRNVMSGCAFDVTPLIGGTRGFLLLADAHDVVREPRLLERYVSTFDTADDITLVIHGVDWDDERLTRELGPIADAAGLTGDGDPDVLALPDEWGLRIALLQRADASLGPRADVDAPVPRYDCETLELLRGRAYCSRTG